MASSRQATGTTDADGLAPLQLTAPKPQPDNFWVLATHGDDVAAVTPGGYALSGWQGGRWSSYVYTDRPVYRPGHVGALERHSARPGRESSGAAQAFHRFTSPSLTRMTIALFDKDMPLSAAGNVAGDLTLPATATLGYYTIRLRNGPASDDADADAGNGNSASRITASRSTRCG